MGSAPGRNLQQSAGPVTATGWFAGLIVVMFVYSGWNAAAYMAEEVRDPGRNLPLALALGTAAVTVIYLLINVLYLSVIPIGELVTVKGSVLDVAAERLLGARAGDVMGIVSLISLAAGINAWTFAGPRVYFAMARDGVFFPAAARVHPTYKTPAVSIVAQAVVGDGPGADRQPRRARATTSRLPSRCLPGSPWPRCSCCARREPNAPRPFKAVGYPVTPAIFVAVQPVMVVNAIYREPRTSALGLLVIAAGIPLYFWFTRKR